MAIKKQEPTLEDRVGMATQFLEILFEPVDCISLRPMKAAEGNEDGPRKKVLYEQCRSLTLQKAIDDGLIEAHLRMLDLQKADGYFGVCPRTESSDKATYELQWQIPAVRCLWADIDDLRDKPLKTQLQIVDGRLKKAGLRKPNLWVSSGGGLHLYWRLSEPHSTECDPRGVYPEFRKDDDGNNHAVRYFKSSEGEKVYLKDPDTFKELSKNAPKLTGQALEIKRVLKKIAIALSGDSTIDLTRLLRIPGSYNRKNEVPRLCRTVRRNLKSSVQLSDFEHLPDPPSAKRKNAAETRRNKRSISRRSKTDFGPSLTAGGMAIHQDGRTSLNVEDMNGLSDRLDSLMEVDEETDRSKQDFAFCRWAIEQDFTPEYIYRRCKDLSKFAERGEDYFVRTWVNAEQGAEIRPSVEVRDNEEQVNSEVIELLAEERDLYQQGGQLVELIETENSKTSHAVNKDRLREIITGTASFYKVDRKQPGERKRVRIPAICPSAILSRGVWQGIPYLKAIRNIPLIAPDGTIVQDQGFHEKTGIFLHFNEEFPPVPKSPSLQNGRTALSELNELVCNFPFATEAHRSAWLAALLTGFASELYSGVTAPLFLIDATQPGCGKTLLVDIISTILTGNPAPRQAAPSSDEEFRKLITAKSIEGGPITLLDNVAGALGCASLDAALTAPKWTDRKLGTSTTINTELKTIWLATGNNVQLAGDLHRRVCHIRLKSSTERPDRRDNFAHPNLLEYVRRNREQMVTDCLTVLAAFIEAGKPEQGLEAWGSFEGWSSVIRNLLVWYGKEDPADTRRAIQADDETAIALGEFLEQLEPFAPCGQGLAQGEIMDILQGNLSHSVALRQAIESLTGKSVADIRNSLGKHLAKYKERIAGGRRLVHNNSGGRRSWSVETVA